MNLFCASFLFLLLCSIGLEANNTRDGRITGGYEARPHSNPYVVSLQTRFFRYRYPLCTGSILSKKWILSAGHCVTDSWAKWLAMDAIVGAHNLAYISNSMIYPISHRIAHPMYRGGVGPYDIAMMRTSRNIQFSDKVQPIRLPRIARSPAYKNTDNLLITGWGALQSNIFITEIPNKLQEVEVTYLPYYNCYRAIDKIKESYEPNPLRRIHNFCTGPISGGIAGCIGDSGGPLVQYIPMKNPQLNTSTTTDKEETSTGFTSNSSSTITSTPFTTDKTSTTTTERTTTERTTSPIEFTTDRTTTSTSKSTISPVPMTTDRTTTTSGSTISALPMTSDRTTTTTPRSTISPIPMTTDRTSTTSGSTDSPIQITTDRYTTTNSYTSSESTVSSIPMNTDGYFRADRVLRFDMVPFVVGVMSWGVVPCGARGAPTVYSNVSNYMDFINKYLYSD